jgi:hypothetical protein
MNSQTPQPPLEYTEYGVPIRNLWHMLLYAWNEVPVNAMRGWALESVERLPPTASWRTY